MKGAHFMADDQPALSMAAAVNSPLVPNQISGPGVSRETYGYRGA
jgi:hypothetical protein